MRFEPIKTLPKRCPRFVEEAYDALVNELGVYAWHWHQPRTMSELERFLTYGSSRSNRGDFFEIMNGGIRFNVFDHVICFKCEMGAPFVLTMPYATPDRFYHEFNQLSDKYYQEKSDLADLVDKGFGCGYVNSNNWKHQLFDFLPKMAATIMPDRFKVRKNGDFAAIIATDSWMPVLSKAGGFPIADLNEGGHDG